MDTIDHPPKLHDKDVSVPRARLKFKHFSLFSRPHLKIFQIFVTFDTYRQRKWCVKLAKFLDIWYQYFICSCCCDECLEGQIERWQKTYYKWVFYSLHLFVFKYLGNGKQTSLINKDKAVYNIKLNFIHHKKFGA